MPTVFLSYDRSNKGAAKRLANELGGRGITVWLDEKSLLAGELWPEALGEAIAASDALVLLWSREAAKSDSVKREWASALAQNKRVLPCLLDRTALPPSLASFHGIDARNLAESADHVANSIGVVTNPAPKSHSHKRKWVWGGVVFVVLSLLGGIATQLLRPAEQLLAGTIGDERGQPLEEVEVSVLLNGEIVGRGMTDGNGHYLLKAAVRPDTEVLLLAKKDQYLIEQRYARMGNTDFGFNMTKTQR
jgi:hypothetical protein